MLENINDEIKKDNNSIELIRYLFLPFLIIFIFLKIFENNLSKLNIEAEQNEIKTKKFWYLEVKMKYVLMLL